MRLPGLLRVQDLFAAHGFSVGAARRTEAVTHVSRGLPPRRAAGEDPFLAREAARHRERLGVVHLADVVEDGQVREASATVGVAELRGTAERATIEIAGGSGFGDPATRPAEEIQADVDDGYVSAEGAAAYGDGVERDGRVRR